MDDFKYHVFCWPAKASTCRVHVRKNDVIPFMKNVISKLTRLGYVERYRKDSKAWYLSVDLMFIYLVWRKDIKVSWRPQDKEYFQSILEKYNLMYYEDKFRSLDDMIN